MKQSKMDLQVLRESGSGKANESTLPPLGLHPNAHQKANESSRFVPLIVVANFIAPLSWSQPLPSCFTSFPCVTHCCWETLCRLGHAGRYDPAGLRQSKGDREGACRNRAAVSPYKWCCITRNGQWGQAQVLRLTLATFLEPMLFLTKVAAAVSSSPRTSFSKKAAPREYRQLVHLTVQPMPAWRKLHLAHMFPVLRMWFISRCTSRCGVSCMNGSFLRSRTN